MIDESTELPLLPAGVPCESCNGSGLNLPRPRKHKPIYSFEDNPFTVYESAVLEIWEMHGERLKESCKESVHRFIDSRYQGLIRENERLNRAEQEFFQRIKDQSVAHLKTVFELEEKLQEVSSSLELSDKYGKMMRTVALILFLTGLTMGLML